MELHLPSKIEITRRDPRTGRFMKGHEPWNKGKKAKEYLSQESYNRMIAGLSRQGRKDIGGQNKREIVAFKDNKFVGVFESSVAAGRKLNVCARNIRSVCHGKRKHAGGYRFFFVENYEKYKHLINN